MCNKIFRKKNSTSVHRLCNHRPRSTVLLPTRFATRIVNITYNNNMIFIYLGELIHHHNRRRCRHHYNDYFLYHIIQCTDVRVLGRTRIVIIILFLRRVRRVARRLINPGSPYCIIYMFTFVCVCVYKSDVRATE